MVHADADDFYGRAPGVSNRAAAAQATVVALPACHVEARGVHQQHLGDLFMSHGCSEPADTILDGVCNDTPASVWSLVATLPTHTEESGVTPGKVFVKMHLQRFQACEAAELVPKVRLLILHIIALAAKAQPPQLQA
jgi:hypothetical protein